uniref:Sodium/calcium exchanger membrane region domain-containing protein n=1 Tax=Pseudo-nitzschia australis TaxID=44445 RepID=A0A7S4AGF3_9STRA|mmetsp:Transcript_19908/g.43258  ORF Transcript_19908/g.43258 Transcript_19908/m.43258 type:complete len:522 (+) Transcript_19908:204-1769(+)
MAQNLRFEETFAAKAALGSSSEHGTEGNPSIGGVSNSKQNFFKKSNMAQVSELSDRENAGIGKTGTFRANAIARRYINSSTRKNSLSNDQGLWASSVRSILPNRSAEMGSLASERTPIVGELIDEDEPFEAKLPYGGSDSSIPLTSIRLENEWASFLSIWIGKPISALLLFAPFALASHFLNWGPQWVFWLNFLTMVPLASILGDFTEEAALHTNDVVGGLLNASFGNAVEVVVAIQALMKDEIRVVQASMIGSIFSNLLLVLGCCFFFGGIYYKEQSFSGLNAMAGIGLLALSSIALILPTPFADYFEIEDPDVLIISRISACFMLFSYLLLLYFQLFTHNESFESEDKKVELADEDEDEEEAIIPMWMALLGLAMTTISVTIFSDYLVESIDGFCTQSGISRTFVGLIILPIVGNAVEHITAVNVAMKDKMDLALGVAIGSCTQIALFVVPVTVIFGWAANKPMTLNFPTYEIVLYILSIFTVSICLGTGKSNWLLGSILVITYIMVGIGFWFEKVEDF